MNIFFKVIKHCTTGKDGETYDPARIYGGIAVFTFMFLSIHSVVFNHATWNAQDFGIGFGALLVGFGLGVSVKSSTEPGSDSVVAPQPQLHPFDEGGGIGK